MPQSHRSALAKFIYGTAPIRIEKGRYECLPLNERTYCPFCSDTLESEFHDVMDYPLYKDLRIDMFDKVSKKHIQFRNLSMTDKFKLLFFESYCQTCYVIVARSAQYLYH